ncbi:MAG: winged helix-turn-helix transcriptional regulator [Candidatus Saccharimonadales bacterium]
MKRTDNKSHCPINFSLETFGDPWSLLIMRDIVCYKKRTYGEFLASKERISSRTLAMRLEHLVKVGILAKQTHKTDKRKEVYILTNKGSATIPILIELATWGAKFDPETASSRSWLDAVREDDTDPRQSSRAAYFETA